MSHPRRTWRTSNNAIADLQGAATDPAFTEAIPGPSDDAEAPADPVALGDETVFELLGLASEERRHLSMRLTGAGIAHRWEVGTDLVVATSDADQIDSYIEEVQNPDGFADDELEAFDEERRRRSRLRGDEQSVRRRRPFDAASRRRVDDQFVLRRVRRVEGLPAPFGFDPRVWAQVLGLGELDRGSSDAEAIGRDRHRRPHIASAPRQLRLSACSRQNSRCVTLGWSRRHARVSRSASCSCRPIRPTVRCCSRAVVGTFVPRLDPGVARRPRFVDRRLRAQTPRRASRDCVIASKPTPLGSAAAVTAVSRRRHRRIRRCRYEEPRHPLPQILAAVYATALLVTSARPHAFSMLWRASRWDGGTDDALLAHLQGPDSHRVALPATRHRRGMGAGRARLQARRAPERTDVVRRFRDAVRDAHPDHGAESTAASMRITELTDPRRILLGTRRDS